MTDTEIINEAVRQLKEWQKKVAEEEAKHAAHAKRQRSLADRVAKLTGAEYFDASRFVAYAMQDLSTKEDLSKSLKTPPNADGTVERCGF